MGLIFFFLLLVKPDVSGSVNVESEASEVQIGRCVRALRIYTCVVQDWGGVVPAGPYLVYPRTTEMTLWRLEAPGVQPVQGPAARRCVSRTELEM